MCSTPKLCGRTGDSQLGILTVCHVLRHFVTAALRNATHAFSHIPARISEVERGGYYTLFRDGPVMHIFGGGPFGNAPAGLEYDLTAKTWAAWTVPAGTPGISEMAMRHADDGRRIYFVQQPAVCTDAPSLLVYDRKTMTWSTDTATPPAGLLARGAAAWVGSELVVWAGNCGGAGSTVGGRYQPPAIAP